MRRISEDRADGLFRCSVRRGYDALVRLDTARGSPTRRRSDAPFPLLASVDIEHPLTGCQEPLILLVRLPNALGSECVVFDGRLDRADVVLRPAIAAGNTDARHRLTYPTRDLDHVSTSGARSVPQA
ncbi:hypothetical protein [Stappia phage SI01]|uniref:Uncharacterized protein n=1 Tax=Stappia phage SI01 TaxID=2847766 RepID=A0AAE7VIH6_9CAUD|nr:hypothetical protein [Stappia phage SI01]